MGYFVVILMARGKIPGKSNKLKLRVSTINIYVFKKPLLE